VAGPVMVFAADRGGEFRLVASGEIILVRVLAGCQAVSTTQLTAKILRYTQNRRILFVLW
jgi:hypothetical protein